MTIQFKLKELMAKKERVEGKKVTYRDMAEATGISTNSLTLMANNRMQQIGLTTIGRILEYFDCEPNDLIVRVQEENRPDQDPASAS